MITDKSGVRDEFATASGAWESHERILAHKNSLEFSFIVLGRELYEFDEMQHWETLGYNSFNAYVSDPDVDIGASTAHRLKKVYRNLLNGLKTANWKSKPILQKTFMQSFIL